MKLEKGKPNLRVVIFVTLVTPQILEARPDRNWIIAEVLVNIVRCKYHVNMD